MQEYIYNNGVFSYIFHNNFSIFCKLLENGLNLKNININVFSDIIQCCNTNQIKTLTTYGISIMDINISSFQIVSNIYKISNIGL